MRAPFEYPRDLGRKRLHYLYMYVSPSLQLQRPRTLALYVFAKPRQENACHSSHRDAYAKTRLPLPLPFFPFAGGANGRCCVRREMILRSTAALGIFRTRLHNIRVENRIKQSCTL